MTFVPPAPTSGSALVLRPISTSWGDAFEAPPTSGVNFTVFEREHFEAAFSLSVENFRFSAPSHASRGTIAKHISKWLSSVDASPVLSTEGGAVTVFGDSNFIFGNSALFVIDVGPDEEEQSGLVDEIIARERDLELWDERDGCAPPKAAFEEALAFARLLDPRAVATLHTFYVSGDAEVGFLWKREEDFLEITFTGDGVLAWAAEEKGVISGDESEFTEASSRTRLPRAVDVLIARFSVSE